jgi:3',5'-cyclic AMP phosphodiesterase CpdA
VLPVVTTIVHLSDLHFGRVDPRVASALRDELVREPPDLVAISGDFTQRARRREFDDARDFVQSLPGHKLCIPGNHDLPLYAMLERFRTPTARFRRAICEQPMPLWTDGLACVIGIDSTRPVVPMPRPFTEGAVSARQLNDLQAAFDRHWASVRVVVLHHPLVLPPARVRFARPIRNAARVLTRLSAMGVDLVLFGHLHLTLADLIADPVQQARAMLCVMAGSATSTRLRAEANSYNRISLQNDACRIDVRAWTGSGFGTVRVDEFIRRVGHWSRSES